MRVVAVVAAAAALGGTAPAVTAATAQAATARTAITAVNIIKDAGAENARPNASGGVVKVGGWKPANGTDFTAVAYGTSGGFPSSSSPGPKNRGKNFFAGGPNGNSSSASQTDSLSAFGGLIGSGSAKFKLSGWLGGFATQTDFATLTVTWMSAAGRALAHTTIGPVTPAQRNDITGLLFRTKSGTVPRRAVSAVLTLRMVR
jgi:hypothetical protein